jgi:O-antigen/teichoic acid export membrane protein
MIRYLATNYRVNKTRFHRLSKEGGWILAGQVASVLGALTLVRVLTEYLQPAEYGQLALSLTIAALMNQVVMGGVTNGVSRYYSIAAEKRDLWGYLKSSKQLMAYATIVVVMIAIALGVVLIALDQSSWLSLMFLIVLFSIFTGFNGALSGVQNAARQRPIVALHAGLDAWLRIGMAVGMVILLGSSSAAVVLGYFLSAFLVTMSQLFFLKRLLRRNAATHNEQCDQKWLEQMWAFSWPFSVWGIFTWAQQVSDRWALQTFTTTADVGQYAVVYQLGFAPIGLLVGLMVSLIAPVLYQRAGDATDQSRNANVHRLVWRIVKISLFLTMLGFVFAWGLHEWLFEWLVAEEYRVASEYLPWMILAGGFFATGQMLSLKLMTEIRSNKLLHAKVGSAIVGIMANIIGAQLFGVTGVVIGLVVFAVVFLFWVVIATWQEPIDKCIQDQA